LVILNSCNNKPLNSVKIKSLNSVNNKINQFFDLFFVRIERSIVVKIE
jgi:hypothetical protein